MENDEKLPEGEANMANADPMPAKLQFIGGEIHIIADPKTGAMQVNAPPNLVIALGLIETAKMILIDRQQQIMRQQAALRPPTILRPGMGEINKIGKAS